MTSDKQPRIVYSTTCRGRLFHVAETLPKNLADNTSDISKFVLLFYNEPEDIRPLLEPYRDYAKTGKLVVYEVKNGGAFHMAHSKNTAHRLAILEGADILVTLDADNFTGQNFDEYINYQLTPKTFMSPFIVQSGGRRFLRDEDGVLHPQNRGIAGRVVVRAQDFIKAGGYNEIYDTWKGEDTDLQARLSRMGLANKQIAPQYLDAIRHGHGLRFKEYPHARPFEEEEQTALLREQIYAADDTVVNFGRFGCGIAYRNLGTEPTALHPVPTRLFGIGLHKTATSSLHKAFQILGFDSFHWDRGDLARDIWDEMNSFGRSKTMEKYYALCDLPIPLLYQKLDAAYPGSKFILTRRNEQAWLKSVERMWDKRYNPTRWEWDVYPFSNRVHRALYGRTDFDAETMLGTYRRHNIEVAKYFRNRQEDLLVMDFDNGAGWRELCGFLRMPIPVVDFPREYATKLVATI